MRKHFWMPVMAMLVSGCAHQATEPEQKISGIYVYEVFPGSSRAASAAGGTVPPAQVTHAPAAPLPETPTVADTPAPAAAETEIKGESVSSGPVDNTATAPLPGTAIPAAELDIQPGQCWVYARIHPRPVQDTVEVKVRDSETRLEVTPAEFRRGIKEVVTREGTRTYKVRPATYREVTEQVLVRPETTRLVVEPAVYEEVEEEVVLEEARTELKPCRTSGAAAYAGTTSAFGFCAVEIPAKTRKVNVTRLVRPETTRTEIVPAQYETVTRWVVDQPAEVIPVTMDDEVDAVAVSELVEPAQTHETEVPAQTVSVSVRRYEGKAGVVARAGRV